MANETLPFLSPQVLRIKTSLPFCLRENLRVSGHLGLSWYLCLEETWWQAGSQEEEDDIGIAVGKTGSGGGAVPADCMVPGLTASLALGLDLTTRDFSLLQAFCSCLCSPHLIPTSGTAAPWPKDPFL